MGSRTDGWKNLLAGMGGRRDKRKYTEAGVFIRRTDEELASAYLMDGYCRNIVDLPADDMTREWIRIENDPNEAILKALAKVQADAKFNEALKWARLYRGSFMVLGIMDGRALDKPLAENLRDKKLEWIYVGDATMMDRTGCVVEQDPRSKTFGEVKQYRLKFVHGAGYSDGQYQMVDASRVLLFKGDPAPKNGVNVDQDISFWGTSAVQAAWQALADFGGVTSNVASIMYELIVGVFKFKDLANKLSRGEEKQIQNRMEIIDMSKSVINSVLLDSEESWERNSANLSGVSDIIDRFMMFLSGVARIPVTRLFGRSAAGMNSTGQEDLDTYYDGIRASQKNDLQPPLQRLVDILAVIEGVPGEDHRVTFNPLTQLTPKDQADVNNKNASTLKTYMDALQIASDNGWIDSPTGEQIFKALAHEGFEAISKVIGLPGTEEAIGAAPNPVEED